MINKQLILNNINQSKKYFKINQDLINKLIEEESQKYNSNKLITKSVKNKLHQIHEIFLNSKAHSKALELLKEKKYDDILKLHTSTLERFNFLKEFYSKIFEITGVPNSILDIACGYNPFSIKYMNLNNNFKYIAYDLNEDNIILLNNFFKQEKYNAISYSKDLSNFIPKEKTDICFIFKFLPLLEQQNKNFSFKLLNNLNVRNIVITYPTKTVSGKSIGMNSNYHKKFLELISNDFKIIKKLEFENELVFIIEKIIMKI